VLVAVGLNKNSFCRMHWLTPFCGKTNLRENRLFAARWAIDCQKGTHDVKISAEKLTRLQVDGMTGQVDELTS